jgi:hypothetical protein
MLEKNSKNTFGHDNPETQDGMSEGRRRRGHRLGETHGSPSATAPLTNSNAPDRKVGGRRRRGQMNSETQIEAAATASLSASDTPDRKIGGRRRRGQTSSETHLPVAAAAPPSPLQTLCDSIRSQHRDRRFAMKQQQKMDRSLESYIRGEFTNWSPDLPEKEREAYNREVKRLLTAARKGEPVNPRIVVLARLTDQARAAFDEQRDETEKLLCTMAKQLPVWPWIEAIPGVGALGLATIVGEVGPLDRYPNVAKLWKRIGHNTIHGLAPSTWKFDSWRPRALTKEEWTEAGFSGERYAQVSQVAQFLWMKQWTGKNKTEDGVGKPDGPYGEIYFKRRQHTAETHPEWTDLHAHKDALRIMMKQFLKNLWVAWMTAMNGYPPTSKARRGN